MTALFALTAGQSSLALNGCLERARVRVSGTELDQEE
jgi:hypothetical protein